MRLLALIVMMFYLCSCTTVYHGSQCRNDNYNADSRGNCDVVAEQQLTHIGGLPWPVWIIMLPVAIVIALAIAHDHAPPPVFEPPPPPHPGR